MRFSLCVSWRPLRDAVSDRLSLRFRQSIARVLETMVPGARKAASHPHPTLSFHNMEREGEAGLLWLASRPAGRHLMDIMGACRNTIRGFLSLRPFAFSCVMSI